MIRNIDLLFLSSILFLLNSCNVSIEDKEPSERDVYEVEEVDSIVEAEMRKLRNYGLNSESRRSALDSLIDRYPAISYFYQQRAMPLFKEDKDELGLPFLEKAASLNPEKYLDYMGFMKCIFSQDYIAAIKDFKKIMVLSGDSYVMDHTYSFYIGISYLQLNEFEKAKLFLEDSITKTISDGGGTRDWVHPLDLMYLGIAHLEMKNCEEADLLFSEALEKYPRFGDVKYYKAICARYMGKTEASKVLFEEAKIDILNGNTINEDNAIYERYPYQVRKSWFR